VAKATTRNSTKAKSAAATKKRKPARAKAPAKPVARKSAPPPTRPAAKPIARPGAKPIVKSTTKSGKTAPSNGAARREKLPERPVPVVPPAIATSDRPAKNQAGLKSRDLEFFRDLLLAKRRELLGDVHSMEQEALRSTSGSNLSNLPIHMADMGTDNYEQEFTLGLVEKDRNLLREINLALAKIQNGTFGICEGTGKPISRARLEAQPWARYSIEHARQMEKGMLPRMM
jgi:RNA polymerase-binding protein DksA